MRRTATLMSLTAALLLFTAAPAAAREGFYLGANVLFNDISGDVNSPETVNSGNGRGLRGGFGLNTYFAIEAGIWKTKHIPVNGGSAANLEAGTLDLKISFPLSGSYMEPYLLVGAGSYTIEQSGISRDGKGGRIGVGIDMYLFPALSLNVGFTHNKVTFTNSGQNIGGKITTMDFGITYHFI
jgi:predicted porin